LRTKLKLENTATEDCTLTTFLLMAKYIVIPHDSYCLRITDYKQRS